MGPSISTVRFNSHDVEHQMTDIKLSSVLRCQGVNVIVGGVARLEGQH